LQTEDAEPLTRQSAAASASKAQRTTCRKSSMQVRPDHANSYSWTSADPALITQFCARIRHDRDIEGVYCLPQRR
jgi:hypothetical protein